MCQVCQCGFWEAVETADCVVFFLLFLSGETAPAVEEYKWWLLALMDISLNCEFMFGTAIFLTSLCGN